jgi:AcrR family transcriptional regulator
MDTTDTSRALPRRRPPSARRNSARPLSARERLLAAADELFYREGVNSVGIDRVIERAGVAKASLYDCFGSKEELIRAYLAARAEARQARITRMLERYATPRERLLGIFDVLGELVADSNYRGCAFVRASAEIRPDGRVKTVCDDSRTWTRSLFAGLAKEAGAREPEHLAQQLMLLYDGVSVSGQMEHDPTAASAARAVATTLLDDAIDAKHSSLRGQKA